MLGLLALKIILKRDQGNSRYQLAVFEVLPMCFLVIVYRGINNRYCSCRRWAAQQMYHNASDETERGTIGVSPQARAVAETRVHAFDDGS